MHLTWKCISSINICWEEYVNIKIFFSSVMCNYQWDMASFSSTDDLFPVSQQKGVELITLTKDTLMLLMFCECMALRLDVFISWYIMILLLHVSFMGNIYAAEVPSPNPTVWQNGQRRLTPWGRVASLLPFVPDPPQEIGNGVIMIDK